MSFGGESGVRVVPIRTMVAAVPAPLGRLPSESSGNSVGLYYPLLGRFQHIASGVVSGERGHQASGEPVSAGVETEQPSVPGPGVQQRNSQNFARNGNIANLDSSLLYCLFLNRYSEMLQLRDTGEDAMNFMIILPKAGFFFF